MAASPRPRRADSSTAIFCREGPDVFCGDALRYWSGGHRQVVWVTASVKVCEQDDGPGPLWPPTPTLHGLAHAALDIGKHANLLQFIWAVDALSLSEVCVAFCRTVAAARRAYIDLRGGQYLERLRREQIPDESDDDPPSSWSSWPSPDDYPRAYLPRVPRSHRSRRHSRSRSTHRSPSSHHSRGHSLS